MEDKNEKPDITQWSSNATGRIRSISGAGCGCLQAGCVGCDPEEDTGLPMVFLHGYGQSCMGWMTTPDGREGWSDMFLKKGHSVFLIDQPRRGEAGQTSVAGTINTETADQTWYTQFRIGTFLDGEFTYNENSQFPQGEEALNQFFRQMTPDTRDFDMTVIAQAVVATIDEAYEKTVSIYRRDCGSDR